MREQRSSDRATSLLIILVIVSFVAMTIDIRAEGEGLVGTFRQGAQTVFSPIQSAATAIVDPALDLVDAIANLAGLRDENARLRGRIAELEDRLDSVAGLEAEVASLRRILNLTPADESVGKVAAHVIARGDTFDASFRIDRGAGDGVLVGNPVVDDFGALIGVVTETTGDASTILPVISASADGVRVKTPTGEVGILRGRGSERVMDFEVLDATEAVFADQLLVTAGSERYPAGISVARVLEDGGPEAGRVQTTAVPLAEFGKLDFVVVLQWTFTTQIQATTTTIPDASTTTGGEG